MDQLREVYSKSPTTTSVNLEFCEIEDLAHLVPLLSKFPNLEELILFGNRLEQLPRDLSSLKNLKKLDISNNMIEGVAKIIQGLKSLPNLYDLHLTLISEDDEEQLLSALPRLIRLNDVEVGLSSSSIEYQGPEALTQDDLEKVAIMYDDIRHYAKDIDPALDKKLAADFDEIVKNIMGELSEVLKSENNTFLTHSHMIIAKFNMYRICQEKVAFLVCRNNKKLGGIVKELSEAFKSVFDQISKVIFESQEKFTGKLQTASNELSRLTATIATLTKDNEKFQSDLESSRIESKQIAMRFQEEKLDLIREMESLQEENKKYLDTLIKHSKSNASSVINSSMYEEKPKLLSQSLASRILTLRQLKDVILEIYESKSKFDEKCIESKMARETMEQHMYTFLNQKYGLRSLIIEWVAAIITGIKTFSSEDNDVAVFGKILRNECDEEFRFVQSQVRETVVELLRIQVKNKHPLKLANEIQRIVEEKMQNSVTEDEWSEIVKYMYNENDSQVLLNAIWNTVQAKGQSGTSRNRTSREDLQKKEVKSNNVGYSDLLKILLDFQLKAHEKFLSPFIKVFRSVGNSRNGVLGETEFVKLCKCLNIGEEYIGKMLTVVDPYENQAITFSECVALFSTELFPNKNLPILQELSLNSS